VLYCVGNVSIHDKINMLRQYGNDKVHALTPMWHNTLTNLLVGCISIID